MIAPIQRSFDRLERQKEALLSELGQWSAAELSFRPGPACWSAVDVLDHIVKVEKEWLGAVQAHLSNGATITIKDRIGAMMVIAVMRSPLRIKVPAAVISTVVPAAAVDSSDTARRWNTVRDDMAAVLRSVQPTQLHLGIFRHPVSGWMTMTQATTFLSAHLRHHEFQFKRLQAATRRI